MSNATILASLGRISFGPFATASTVPAASVTGLGALATKSSVETADLAVTTGKIAADAVTAAKLGANEKRQIVRAFGYVNGSTGALVSGFGLTSARSTTGVYTVTLDSAAPNTDYTVVATPRIASNLDLVEASGTARTTTVIPLAGRNTSTGTASDVPFFSVAVLW